MRLVLYCLCLIAVFQYSECIIRNCTYSCAGYGIPYSNRYYDSFDRLQTAFYMDEEIVFEAYVSNITQVDAYTELYEMDLNFVYKVCNVFHQQYY